MNIILSNSSKEPIYKQIKDQLKQTIINGELKAGDALPSIRMLARDLQISVITTKRAYEDLEAEGFIESMVGRGSFVAGQNEEWLKEQKIREIEGTLLKGIKAAKSIHLSLEEVQEMVKIMFEEES